MLDFDRPYASGRSPVCARNLVASSQPLAAQAGVDLLRRGGNAVDAALAAAMTLTVVEPTSNGVGGDAFAMVWDGRELTGLNASGRSPAAWTPARFAGRKTLPERGWDTITVPGAVSAWVALSDRYGRLPFATLFEAAVRYAREGFQVGPVTAAAWAAAQEIFAGFADFAAHFLPAPAAGGRFFRPDLARSLEDIALTRGRSFYEGALAERMAAASRAAGGALTLADLAGHRADWVRPLAQPYRDLSVHEIPPNGQGLAAQIALGILQHLEPGEKDAPGTIHRQIEAVKIALRAAGEHFGDLAAMRIAPAALLDEGALAAAAAGIGERAAPLPPAFPPASHGTICLCAADAGGMMVSMLQSNYMGFGSGIVIPGTGIALQNRGRAFNLEPGHPNEVGPAKRPFHTIIPGFVSRDGEPLLAFGIMGGLMQAQGHVQLIHRIFDLGQNPQAASDAPRWRVNADYSVSLETGMPQTVREGLERRGHRVEYEPRPGPFGGAQLILRTADGYVAGSDHRKDGQAAGF